MNIFDDLKSRYRLGDVALQFIFWNVGIFLVSIPLFYQFKFGQFVFPDWIALFLFRLFPDVFQCF